MLPWLLLTLLLPAVSGAVVTGTYPSSPETWRVYGKAVQLGASLVTNFTDYRFNDQLLAQSSDSVQSFEENPADAVIKKAYLFWAGSAPGPIGNEFADQTASLQFTDGFTSNLTADNCITALVAQRQPDRRQAFLLSERRHQPPGGAPREQLLERQLHGRLSHRQGGADHHQL